MDASEPTAKALLVRNLHGTTLPGGWLGPVQNPVPSDRRVREQFGGSSQLCQWKIVLPAQSWNSCITKTGPLKTHQRPCARRFRSHQLHQKKSYQWRPWRRRTDGRHVQCYGPVLMTAIHLIPWHPGPLKPHINFLYQFLQRILPTNTFLKKIGSFEEPTCFLP